MTRLGAAAAIALAIAACGSGGATSPSPTPTPTSSPTATATVATSDDERIVVVQAGYGAYLETTFAGALIRSTAASHTARQVDVHLEVTAGARHIGSTVVHLDSLDPGATVPTGGRIQGSGATGESVEATITVGSWDPVRVEPFAPAGQASFACSRCARGPESGDVTVPLTVSAAAPSGLPLELTAMCTDAGGRIVGGGAQTFAPPAGAGTVPADIPAVVSAPPVGCLVGVAPAAL